MKVVGVGCGPGMMTEEAIAAVKSASLVMGSKRAIDLAAAFITEGCEVRTINDFSSLEVPGHAVVLSTGDPLFAGLWYLGGEIVPGISSLQVAASRLRIPLDRVTVVIAHGTSHDRAFLEVQEAVYQGRIAFIVADPGFSLTGLALHLPADEEISLVVCEDLGYPGERIAAGTVADPPLPRSRLFSVIAGRLGSEKTR